LISLRENEWGAVGKKLSHQVKRLEVYIQINRLEERNHTKQQYRIIS
jgi:hypothetical protein